MPKAILEFNLPEESADYKIASNATGLWCVLWDLDQHLRTAANHGDNTCSASELRVYLSELMADEHISFDMGY